MNFIQGKQSINPEVAIVWTQRATRVPAWVFLLCFMTGVGCHLQPLASAATLTPGRTPTEDRTRENEQQCISRQTTVFFTYPQIKNVNGSMLLKDFAGAVPVFASFSDQLKPDKRLLESIVKIKTQGNSGTGVAISNDGRVVKILTSAHVVAGSSPQEITLETVYGKTHLAQSIRFFHKSDLAEISADIELSTCLEAAPLARSLKSNMWAKTRDSSVQEDVYIIGYPEALSRPKIVKANAILQSYSGNPRAGGYSIMYHYPTESSTEIGMSGAPVFDSNGYVVGIHGQVDTIKNKSGEAPLRTGYGLAVPINTWINQTAKELSVKTRESSVDLALLGAYQLSSGMLDQSISSLSEAISRAIGEYRELQTKNRDAYRREVMEPFQEVLRAEVICKQQAEQRKDLRSFYPSYQLQPPSNADIQREIAFCISSRRKMDELEARQVKSEQLNVEITEKSMAFSGSQHHLYALRALAYAVKGQANRSQADIVKCLRLTGPSTTRSRICQLSSRILRINNQ